MLLIFRDRRLELILIQFGLGQGCRFKNCITALLAD